MVAAGDLPAEDLIAYADGELRGARKEVVEAHLAVCANCRTRLAEFRQVDRALREGSPPLDDPAARAALRARIARTAARAERPVWPRVMRALGAAVLVILAVIALPVSSSARGGIARFLRFDAFPAAAPRPAGRELSRPATRGVPPPVGSLGFVAVEPARLPLGLALVERSAPHPARLELTYQNSAYLKVVIVQEPAATTSFWASAPNARTVWIDGAEVLWLQDPRPGTVSMLAWERGGVLFTLTPVIAPAGGFLFEDARQVVAALLDSGRE